MGGVLAAHTMGGIGQRERQACPPEVILRRNFLDVGKVIEVRESRKRGKRLRRKNRHIDLQTDSESEYNTASKNSAPALSV